MEKQRKTGCFFIFLAGIFLTFSLAGIPNAAQEIKKETEKKDKVIVAKVNGQPIYEETLTPYVQKEVRKFKKFSGKKDTSMLEKRIQKRVLNKVIGQELINQESKKLKINDIEEKIVIKIKEMKSKYPSEELFKRMLETKKTTEEDLKESVKNKIYVDEYLEKKGVLNPNIPEDELRTYYEKNKNNFKRNETIRARHILIMVKEDASPEEKEQARLTAEGIRKEIMEGRDFAEMAKKHSQDGRAETGGDLGYISKGYMPSEFDTAAFALEKETLSDVVETKHGFHIIKVEDRKPGDITPYEDIKDFIKKYLQERHSQKNMSSLIEELREKAEIEILLSES